MCVTHKRMGECRERGRELVSQSKEHLVFKQDTFKSRSQSLKNIPF